jgi:cytochrome P450 family 135
VTAGLPPGPSSRLTTGIRWLRNPVDLLEDCRRRYGDTFTLEFPGAGKNVFFSDPETIKEIFARDRRGNGMPSSRDLLLKPVMGPRSVLLLEGEEHMRVRKLMLPPFHGERMRAYTGTIEEATEREVASWPVGRRFALHPSMQSITLEVILSAVFGVSAGARREELRGRLLAILETGQSAKAQLLGVALMRVGGRPYEAFAERLRQADELLLAEIAERRRDPDLAEREDILSLLVGARFEDGTSMSDQEIRDQLMTLLLAGHETTATALAWTFDLLFRHPSAARRLREEIEKGDADDYLGAVCTESLRVRPVIPAVGRRLAEPLQVNGHELEPGQYVNACIYLVHTSAEVYEMPYAFRPERYLDSKPETYSWIPFGGGTRRCIGAAFATLEMKTVLRTVLSSVRLEPGSERPEPVGRRNITLSPKHGTPAIVREPSAASRKYAPS